jgi:hypothetical protein
VESLGILFTGRLERKITAAFRYLSAGGKETIKRKVPALVDGVIITHKQKFYYPEQRASKCGVRLGSERETFALLRSTVNGTVIISLDATA